MLGRLILFILGLALFITSCNNLLSQWGGEDKLRTVDLGTAVRTGIGDAEYVQFHNVCPGPELHSWQGSGDKIVFFRIKPCQQAGVVPVERERYQLVGWAYVGQDAESAYYPRLPAGSITVKGLVRKTPRSARDYVRRRVGWEEQDLIWLRLDAEPIHWGWWLAGMIAPVLLLFGMESRSFKRKKQT